MKRKNIICLLVIFLIELLTNLDKVPEAGALVVVTFPKPKDGSGFPARIFAMVPNIKKS